MLDKLKKIYMILRGKRLPTEIVYTFVSKIKIDRIPLGEWRVYSSEIHVDEVNNTWLEKIRIATEDDIIIADKSFRGSIDELRAYKKPVTTKQLEKMFEKTKKIVKEG